MFLRAFAVTVVAAAALPLAAQAPAGLAASVERQLPALTETYKQLHRAPELSRHEEQTSAFVAAELRKLGYTVTEHVGKYEDGAQAFGIVAVLENGPGGWINLCHAFAQPTQRFPGKLGTAVAGADR